VLPMTDAASRRVRHLFDAELRYEDGMAPVCELDDRGHLAGSGTGRVEGPSISPGWRACVSATTGSRLPISANPRPSTSRDRILAVCCVTVSGSSLPNTWASIAPFTWRTHTPMLDQLPSTGKAM
jgi:hypothetical protein